MCYHTDFLKREGGENIFFNVPVICIKHWKDKKLKKMFSIRGVGREDLGDK